MTRSPHENPIVTLEAPESVVLGSVIPITMRIENRSASSLALYLSGRDTVCDLSVTNASGDVVWRRLEGEILPAILRLEVIEPGKTVEFADTWDQRDDTGRLVPPGSYTVRGAVPTDGSSTLESPAVELRIEML